jgi:hypothetical protein
MVPTILTPEQKKTRMNICADILQNTENDRNILGNVITCDESWFLQYDLETKSQYIHWQSPRPPRKKKHGRTSPISKQWWSFFLYLRDCSYDWVPEGQTVNQVYCKEVLTTLRERVRRKGPEMWKNGSWILHHKNTPAHNTTLCQEVSGEAQDPHGGTSALLTCHSPMWHFFYLFPKIKSALKGTRFESVDAKKANATEVMKELLEKDLQHYFQ